MVPQKRAHFSNGIPQITITFSDEHSDSGHDTGVQTKTNTYGSKKSAGKKLVCSRAWMLSDQFKWYDAPADMSDQSLDDPYVESSYSYSGRTILRAADAAENHNEQAYSLDRGFVESDFYCRAHPERGNPLADIYQIQAEYEDSIAWEKFKSTGMTCGRVYGYGNDGIQDGVSGEEGEEIRTGENGNDFKTFRLLKTINKKKDMTRERNTGLEVRVEY